MNGLKDKFGELLGAAALIVGAVYLAYKVPAWIDDGRWKHSFCYLAAVLLVTAGITLIIELTGSKTDGMK